MSEAQPEKPADAWGQPISEELQADLTEMLSAWDEPGADRGKRKGPFDGIELSGADAFWLAEQSGFDWIYGVPNLHLEGASLRRAHLEGAKLSSAHLEGASFAGAHLEGADLSEAHLEGASLGSAYLEGAFLEGAHLERASLESAELEGANLSSAHLEGAFLRSADLQGTDLGGAFFDSATDFAEATWVAEGRASAGPRLADAHWGGANLTVVEWDRIKTLHDERAAETRRTLVRGEPKSKDRTTRVEDYQAASRAYRLLFVALRNQGLTAPPTRYHYRAELMDRKALWHRRRYTRWLFSWLLGTFAGYGDYIGRLFLTYGVVIVAFALAMFAFSARTLSPDSIGDVLILSVTSFHGRGVQPPGLRLTDVLAAFSGVEAVFGLLIEGLFIAAFTRRVTGG